MIVPGGTERPEGICEEANQTEPSRQHQQQGEEEDEELHDDEAESERQNKRQTLLQRQTGQKNRVAFSFLNTSLYHIYDYFLFFIQIALRNALLKKRKQHR